MTRRTTRIIASATLLTTTLMLGAHAQGVRIGNRLIPASSIELPNDIGVRAHTHIQILVGPSAGKIGFFGGLGPAGGMTPAQLRSFYNLPSTGGSQIIAIVDAYHDPNALSDFNTYAAEFGLPSETSTTATASTNKVFQVLYGSGTQPAVDSTGGWELEEALDIEMAHAMAPSAKILLVEAASTSFADLMTAENAATNYVDGNGLKPKEVSNSWGGSEFSGENTYDTNFSGSTIAYFASAGDTGGLVEYPSASPYVVSAGGTLVTTSSTGVFVSESGWSSGGGGPSAYESRPTFQNGISPMVGAWRGTPDIAFDANPSSGVSEYDSYTYEGTVYGWLVVGGTSVASPSLAGIANLAATAQGTFPAGSQALLSTIYSNLGTDNFRDIITGNNGYAAGTGWDFVTGVGTCLGLGGLQSSSTTSLTITSLSPGSATAGGAAFTLTVNGSGFVAASTIAWNGEALTTTFHSSTQLSALVPATDIATIGTASVVVVNPGNVSSNAATFTIDSGVSITTLSPSSVTAGGATFTLTVTGEGFVSGSVIHWNGSSLVTTDVSSTELTTTIKASSIATAGTVSVTVVNPGGATSNIETFTILTPLTLTSLSPATITAGSPQFTMTVNGTGFLSGATVNWGGSTMSTTFISSTQLTTVVPASDIATASTVTVKVDNPGGATSAGATFTITKANNPVPVLSSISPNSANKGSGTITITLTGTNFVSGSQVQWKSGSNTTALTVTYVSSTTLTATVPKSLLATEGTASVAVSNPTPGGGTSGSVSFTIR